jgi:hypothetical protein
MRFVGRGRTVADAEALGDDAPLSGTRAQCSTRSPRSGSRSSSMPGGLVHGRLVHGHRIVASRRGSARAECGEAGAGDRITAASGAYRDETLRRIGASAADGVAYERLAGGLLSPPRAARRSERHREERARPGVAVAVRRLGRRCRWCWSRSLMPQHLDLVRRFVAPTRSGSAHGIATELMIVSADVGHGPRSLVGAGRDAVGAGPARQVGKRAGIFVRDAHARRRRPHAAEERRQNRRERAVAERCSNGSRVATRRRLAGAAASARTRRPPRRCGDRARRTPPWSADNGHGGFAADLREYVIDSRRTRMTPAPWTNVIANADFGTLVSESGSASTWSENAHEFR